MFRFRLPVFFIFGACLLLLVGCEKSLSVEKTLVNTRAYIANGDYRSAAIGLKKILQQEHDNAQARALLGDVYLAIGNYAGSEKEYRKAIQYGLNRPDVIYGLGKSMIAQSKFKSVQHEAAFDDVIDKMSKVSVLIVKGDASIGLGKYSEAEDYYTGALNLIPDSIGALIGMAKFNLATGHQEIALDYISKSKKIDPLNDELLLVEGGVYNRLKEYAKEEQVYRAIVKNAKIEYLTQYSFRAYVNLIMLQMKQEKFAAAKEDLKSMQRAAPEHPLVVYLDALIAYQDKKYDYAQTQLQLVLKKAPEFLPATFLLGTVNYALGNFEQANSLLNKFVNSVPTHIQARKLLAAARIKLNRHQDALDALAPIVDKDTHDTQLLLMAGVAASSIGDMSSVEKYYRLAIKSNPESKLIREELAKVYLKEGNIDGAIDELRSKAELTESFRSILILVQAHVQKGDFNSAVKLIEQSISKHGKKPELLTLLGVVYMHKGNQDTASTYLSQAINVSKDYLPAKNFLAKIELENGNLSRAGNYYQEMLIVKQNYLPALLGMAQLSEIEGQTTRAFEWLKKAVELNSKNHIPYLVLGNYYLKRKQYNDAMLIAEQLYALNKEPPSKRLLARAYLANKKYLDSKRLFLELLRIQPNNIALHLELANNHLRLKELHEARKVLNKAYILDKKNIAIHMALAKLEINAGNSSEAIDWANRLVQLYPDMAVSHELMGDVYVGSNNLTKALASYDKAVAIKAIPKLIIKQAKVHAFKGSPQLAIAILTKASETHKDNVELLVSLAAFYQAESNLTQAQWYYEKILSIQPENVVALNNLAYINLETDPKKSLVYAQRAHSAAPSSIAVIDTLGWSLILNNKVKEGVDYLAPLFGKTINPTIHYHYAVGLVRLDRINEAKKILRSLLEPSKVFPEKNQAQELLATLH